MPSPKSREKINLWDVVPCRGSHITTRKEGEEVILSFPRFKRAWMNRYLIPKGMSKEIHVRLEEHGSAVWELIDGRRTVREIIAGLADHFHGEEGYEARVSTYLLQLRKDGMVKFMIQPPLSLTKTM